MPCYDFDSFCFFYFKLYLVQECLLVCFSVHINSYYLILVLNEYYLFFFFGQELISDCVFKFQVTLVYLSMVVNEWD